MNRSYYTKEYLTNVYARDIYNSTPYWYQRMLADFNQTACLEHKDRIKYLLEIGIPESEKFWEEFNRRRALYQL